MSKDYQQILNKWLTLGDHQYLAARLLMIHGLYIIALPNAAMAIEYYLKCAMQLKDKEDKKIKHELTKGFKILGLSLDESDKKFIKALEKSYDNKYPEKWGENPKWEENLEELDNLVVSLRNYIHSIANGQLKIQDTLQAAKNGDNFSPSIAARFGTLEWKDIFLRANRYFGHFKFFG